MKTSTVDLGLKIALSIAVTLAILTRASEAKAFRGCDDVTVTAAADTGPIYRCWPAYSPADKPMGQLPFGNGTLAWSFCYTLNDEGLELQDLAYHNLTVANRISLPYVMTQPSATPGACNGTAMASEDTPHVDQIDNPESEMGCVHVPSTVCHLPSRVCTMGLCENTSTACTTDADCVAIPATGQLDPADCNGTDLCVPCRGVCAGSQLKGHAPPEIMIDEANAGGADADLVLTVTTYNGGHQIVQRYRFTNDGQLATTVRFGGASALPAHDHVLYWRMELDLPGAAAGGDAIQRCDGAASSCADVAPVNGTGWSTPLTCQCANVNGLPVSHGKWRVYDAADAGGGTPSRTIVIDGGPNDGAPGVCGPPDKSFCALPASMTEEGLAPNPAACTDGLNPDTATCTNLSGAGSHIAFWYVAHVPHDPCDPAKQDYCNPARGAAPGGQAIGPTLSLRGDWTGSQCALAGVLTQRNDNRRTGANLGETALTTSNVAGLQRIRDIAVQGQVIAQPLVAKIAGAGCTTRTFLYVVTMANFVYVIDAETGVQINARQLDGPPFRIADGGSFGGISNPYFGIASTPVIDPVSQTLFLVTRTDDGMGASFHNSSFHLHALNALTLEDYPGSPTHINPNVTVPNIWDNSRFAIFNATRQNNRPALLRDHGFIYLGFGALPFDDATWHGFLFTYTYNQAAFTLNGSGVVLTSDPTNAGGIDGGGLWQGGNGFVADDTGNVYLQTGNIPTPNQSTITELGDAALKIQKGGLALLGRYIPADSDALNNEDMDVGSSGPVLLPHGTAGDARLMVLGKQGVMSLHDTPSWPVATNNAAASNSVPLQRMRVTFNQHSPIPCIVASCVTETPSTPTASTCAPNCQSARENYPHVHATPVLWDRGTNTALVYTWGEKDVVRAHSFDKTMGLFQTRMLAANDPTFFPPSQGPCVGPNGCFSRPDTNFTTVHVQPDLSGNGQNNLSHVGPNGMPGGSLALSANGGTAGTGIIWAAVNTAGNSEGEFVPGVLRAYDATPGTSMTELWNDFNVSPHYFLSKFTPPTVFDGRVYMVGNTIPAPPARPNPCNDPGACANPGADPSQPYVPLCTTACTFPTEWTNNPADIQGHVFVYGLP